MSFFSNIFNNNDDNTTNKSFYGAIKNDDPPLEGLMISKDQDTTSKEKQKMIRQKRLLPMIVVMAVLSSIIIWYCNFSSYSSDDDKNVIFDRASFPMPDGVNIGSWLSLEDYFFVGKGHAVEVATPDDAIAGRCLPPLHTGPSNINSNGGPMWHSETDLFTNLMSSNNNNNESLAHAIQVFHAYRKTFFKLGEEDDDLVLLSDQLGIRKIRVPTSWCMTDYNPEDIVLENNTTNNNNEELLKEQFTCQDPFFKDVLWPAVPRSMIVNLLKACARHGVKATLDVHTYPGGTSPGTFSGVWPRWPRFWTYGDQPAADNNDAVDIGRQLWKDLVEWLESLDDEILQGLQGVTPMNEPAHLAGIFANGKKGNDGSNDEIPFLPPLPPHLAQAYQDKLSSVNNSSTMITTIPNGPHLRVLKWLDDAVDVFRQSSLKERGIRLIVNVHESVFQSKIFLHDNGDGGGMRLIAGWWSRVTTVEERRTWAVLDVHHYDAWGADCMGATTTNTIKEVSNNNDVDAAKIIQKNYTCNNVKERTETLKRCAEWANTYRQAINEECGGDDTLLMSGEMSASTHHSVKVSCRDKDTLKAMYLSQLEAARQANIELYWWSYQMPYGDTFRSAWSFRHFLHRMGISSEGIDDEPKYPCQ